MGQKISTATHIGKVKIGDIEINCAVLEDKRRVLTQRDLCLAIGRAEQAGRITSNTKFR